VHGYAIDKELQDHIILCQTDDGRNEVNNDIRDLARPELSVSYGGGEKAKTSTPVGETQSEANVEAAEVSIPDNVSLTQTESYLAEVKGIAGESQLRARRERCDGNIGQTIINAISRKLQVNPELAWHCPVCDSQFDS